MLEGRETVASCTGKPSLTISAKPVGVWVCVASVDRDGRTIFIADAHRDGKRFVVRADEKLTAFVELESAIRAFESRALDVSDKFRHKKLWVGRYCFFGGKGYHESV
jgi:hypothetical protein